MTFVIFQYLLDIAILIGVGGIAFAIKKKNKSLMIYFIIAILSILLLKNFIYVNFTGSNTQVKKEANAANTIFQAKMNVKEKHLKEFNYTKDFQDVSKTIENQANEIHNSIK